MDLGENYEIEILFQLKSLCPFPSLFLSRSPTPSPAKSSPRRPALPASAPPAPPSCPLPVLLLAAEPVLACLPNGTPSWFCPGLARPSPVKHAQLPAASPVSHRLRPAVRPSSSPCYHPGLPASPTFLFHLDVVRRSRTNLGGSGPSRP
ncbi:hypothetical protein J5N97_022673 [Dioscorea zingiberensis]|uniref:Uncharacterized protein n=1 Tax=Dioscorea zingiberensis TaxID=325984 RepID=A0A9D5HAT4_9LILI|nr:hypothetical protein J5N97_022673 [Dioscorea zingiberensis]